jgi:hypothetical protein
MPSTYESLRVFISCPKDTALEKKVAKNIIQRISITCKESLGLELEAVCWDDFVPQTPKLPEERIQSILNNEIPKCQIFILVLWKRYGSTEPRYKKSNTEREVQIAIRLLKTQKKIMFLSYFRDLQPNPDFGPQEKSVISFRNKLQKEGIFYKSYSRPDEFKEFLVHDLYRTILRFCLSTNKHKALRKFWSFGIPDRLTSPILAIIYPSMNKTFMGSIDDPNIWLNRLEPNIVFEDFKALMKLDKTLRLLGFNEFRIFNSSNLPSDLRFMNRFWICLRNDPGLEQAKKYQKISKFEMVRKSIRINSYILCKPTLKREKHFKISSPLAKYLYLQRSDFNISGEWHREMDNIIAKDYAILARFRDEESDVAMKDGILFDYFLAGLRGLGTWGAAWFIDRNYKAFNFINDTENVQYLLEVEYRDGRIYKVRDVSDKPKEYFNKENSITTIKKNIELYLKHIQIP